MSEKISETNWELAKEALEAARPVVGTKEYLKAAQVHATLAVAEALYALINQKAGEPYRTYNLPLTDFKDKS